MSDTFKGILALVAASTVWGLSPLFYKALAHIPPAEVLSHRIFWSFVFFTAVLLLRGRISELLSLIGHRKSLRVVLVASVMIAVNWFLFIMSIQIGRATEASFGYYIFPLVAICIGLLAFGETLSRPQWVAVALAAAGVVTLAIGLGIAPWISIVVSVTFGYYGMVKKRLTVGPLVSVTAEVWVLIPLAAGYLAWTNLSRGGGWMGTSPLDGVLLVTSGPLTALPLIFFSFGAQRVPMSTVGLVQYLNPTLQFLCAVLIFAEPFGPFHAAAFGLIWAALVIYSASTLRQESARRRASTAPAAEVVVMTKSSSDGSANP